MNHITNFVEAGFDANGKSAILDTKKIDSLQPMPTIPSFNITNIYYVKDTPITTQSHNNNSPYEIDLPPQALRFLICRIPPINKIIEELNDPHILTPQDYLKIGMHKTTTVDYFYVSKGKVTLYMENGDTYDFTEGDAYAMRGAVHGWVNYSDDYCDLVGVMVGISK